MGDKAGDGRVKEIRDALWVLTRGKGVLRDDLVELLKGKLNLLQRLWDLPIEDPSKTPGEIARRIAGHLEDMEPRPDNLQLSATVRLEQFRQVVKIIFNIASRLPEVEGLNQGQRFAWLETSLEKKLRIDERTARRDVDYAAYQIAKALAAKWKSVELSVGQSRNAEHQPVVTDAQVAHTPAASPQNANLESVPATTVTSSPPSNPIVSLVQPPFQHRARATLRLVLYLIVSFALGWFLIPRIYRPSVVWSAEWRELSVFTVSNLREIAAISAVTLVALVWILADRFLQGRPSGTIKKVLACCLLPVAVTPAMAIGILEHKHQQEMEPLASVRDLQGDAGLRVNEDFFPFSGTTQRPCDNEPVDRGQFYSERFVAGDIQKDFCHESNGELKLAAIASVPVNGYDGRERLGMSSDFYAETLLRPNLAYRLAGCGLAIIPVASQKHVNPLFFGASPPEGVSEWARDIPFGYNATVRDYWQSNETIVRGSPEVSGPHTIPMSVANREAFDNAPRDGWLKFGLLRQGNQYKLFINDHLMLDYVWPKATEQVRVQIQALAMEYEGPISQGIADCQFDYFKLWVG